MIGAVSKALGASSVLVLPSESTIDRIAVIDKVVVEFSSSVESRLRPKTLYSYSVSNSNTGKGIFGKGIFELDPSDPNPILSDKGVPSLSCNESFVSLPSSPTCLI